MKRILFIITIILLSFGLGWWVNEMRHFAKGVIADDHYAMTNKDSPLLNLQLHADTTKGVICGTALHEKQNQRMAELLDSLKASPPIRVKNIPKEAFWVGGVDGGQWYIINDINTKDKTIHFKIYNDFNGNLIVDKIFKLHCKIKIEWDNISEQISVFDGKHILLTGTGVNDKNCYFE